MTPRGVGIADLCDLCRRNPGTTGRARSSERDPDAIHVVWAFTATCIDGAAVDLYRKPL